MHSKTEQKVQRFPICSLPIPGTASAVSICSGGTFATLRRDKATAPQELHFAVLMQLCSPLPCCTGLAVTCYLQRWSGNGAVPILGLTFQRNGGSRFFFSWNSPWKSAVELWESPQPRGKASRRGGALTYDGEGERQPFLHHWLERSLPCDCSCARHTRQAQQSCPVESSHPTECKVIAGCCWSHWVLGLEITRLWGEWRKDTPYPGYSPSSENIPAGDTLLAEQGR